MAKEVTFKTVQALFKAMQDNGIKEIFMSKEKQGDVLEAINNWFYSRNRNVADDKYVWGEGTQGGWSFVKNGDTDRYEDHLKITFLDYM